LIEGDGANDVTMIQEAHIGLGISGKEGSQAANSSDFSIPEFKCLQRLILVHGHWSYYRIANFLLSSFYKAVAFYLTHLMFQVETGFSAVSVYEQWTLALYNVTWTSLPVICVGIFDQDYPAWLLMKNPELYKQGPQYRLYNATKFFTLMVNGVYHAAITVFLTLAVFDPDFVELHMIGIEFLSVAIVVINSKVAYFRTKYWAWPIHASMIITLAFWFFVYGPVYSLMFPAIGLGHEVYGYYLSLFSEIGTYFKLLIAVTVVLLPDIFASVVEWGNRKE
jgi:magnesium-transporting ATPase (P-type)